VTIAVNARYLIASEMEGYGYFLYETLKRMIAGHPGDQFILIFDRPYDQQFIFGPNVKAVVAGPAARHPLLWKFWYDARVPAILKKYKADLFLSTDGFCSLSTAVPQCIVVHDLAFLHGREFLRSSHFSYYKRYTGRFLKKARAIATVSAYTKNDILKNYPTIASEKIDIIYSAARNIFRPLDPAEKEEVKKKFTGGQEYFLYAGAIHPRKNLRNLLRAFSIFKKRMHSNMKLVLAGRLAWRYHSFLTDLKSYKYRNDVIMTGYISEQDISLLMGAAYSLVYPSLHEGFGVPVLEAMRCHVPVLTSAATAMQEIAGNAAVYATADDHLSIAEQMMRLYKDEELCRRLVEEGKKQYARYDWTNSTELLWQCMMRALA
jgi:glycosyltransferase involved in cell wall biosynthesis